MEKVTVTEELTKIAIAGDLVFPKVKITDYEAIEKINPEWVRRYFTRKGWECIKSNEIFCIYQKDKYKILLPVSTQPVDWVYRMAEAIEAIAGSENRSQINVWLDVVLVSVL